MDLLSSFSQIIPIEGDFEVNDEPQKTFEEILPEIVISRYVALFCVFTCKHVLHTEHRHNFPGMTGTKGGVLQYGFCVSAHSVTQSNYTHLDMPVNNSFTLYCDNFDHGSRHS